MTKAQARKMMLAALAKCKKVWTRGPKQFWFPTESMIAIESTILDIVESNK
jgi:hypothetical protein